MTKPTRFLFPMFVFLLIIVTGTSLLFDTLKGAFLANAIINGVIFACLLIGIFHSFRTVTLLSFEVNWIEGFRRQSKVAWSLSQNPRLMASGQPCWVSVMRELANTLSPTAMHFDGVATRLDESREISEYFIGLLGFWACWTFWGLLDTVQNIGAVIANLNVSGENVSDAFEGLKGLQTRCWNGYSLFLIAFWPRRVAGFGILALQSGQAQTAFITTLKIGYQLTRLSGNNVVNDGDTLGTSLYPSLA